MDLNNLNNNKNSEKYSKTNVNNIKKEDNHENKITSNIQKEKVKDNSLNSSKKIDINNNELCLEKKGNLKDIKENTNDNDENNKNNEEINKINDDNILSNANNITIEKIKDKDIKNENIENNKKSYRKEMSIKDWGCKNLDIYEIINNPIGEGTFGTVFKAYYKGPKEYAEKIGIPEIVALKKIKTENEKQGFPITALREIMIMKRLCHKNILQLLEVVTSKLTKSNNFEKNAYLVFEYMEHDLCSLIHSKINYEKSQIKLILYQLIKGLEYLHNNNVLHRDIKPQNILLNNKGVVKIGDFGLSRIFSETIKNKKYTNRVVTRWYRAPELFLGDIEYGPGIDIWSLGCVFWEMLTGEVLFLGDNDKNVFFLICKKCGTPNEINWPGISKLPKYNEFFPQKQFETELNQEYKKYKKIDEITFDLLMKMICLNPKERITIKDILNHPYFVSHEPKMCEEKDMPKIEEEFHFYTKSKMNQQRQQHAAKGEYDKNNNKKFIGKKRNYK